jgi:hypothetical protein
LPPLVVTLGLVPPPPLILAQPGLVYDPAAPGPVPVAVLVGHRLLAMALAPPILNVLPSQVVIVPLAPGLAPPLAGFQPGMLAVAPASSPPLVVTPGRLVLPGFAPPLVAWSSPSPARWPLLQKCIAVAMSARTAYARALIGCMPPWGPRCMLVCVI